MAFLMIERYSRKTMTALWSDDHRFSIWLEIECLVCEAQAELWLIPQKDAIKIRKNAQFNVERICEIEKDIHHDVLAFLTSVSESLGEESRFVHRGLTSSDIVDSCFGVQLTKAADILLEDIDTLCAAFKKKAEQHKDTIMIGRSHGMHGEPITFGFKMAQAYAEFERWRNRLAGARTEIAVIALSGPMGNFAHLSPDIERMVAKKNEHGVGASFNANHPSWQTRFLLFHIGRDSIIHRASGDRNQTSATKRTQWGDGILWREAKGIIRHAP